MLSRPFIPKNLLLYLLSKKTKHWKDPSHSIAQETLQILG